MTQRHELLALKGSFGDYQPITVHLDGAISIRDRTAPYKGAMFAAYPGDIIFSKIDARNGAIGMLPFSIPKAVVTPEFPVFVADPAKLNSGFLRLVLRTGGFLKALRKQATGTSGRKRVTPEAFLDLKVPLPSVDEQVAIVGAYDASLAAAAAKEALADAAEAKAMADFEAALGFGPPAPLPDRPVLVASFRNLDRWSHESVLRQIVGQVTSTVAWPMVCLRDVIADLENGWSPKCLDRPAETGEWGVLKVSAVSAARYRPSENKALPSNLKERPRLQVRKGDVLITRASGVAHLVGVPAYVDETPDRLLICDKIFRAVLRSKSPIEPRFLANVLRIHTVRAQIVKEFSTNSGMMKNVSKPVLMSLAFPLPPLEGRRNLIDNLEAGRAEATRLRAEAAVDHVKAWADFELSVYGPDPAIEPAATAELVEEAA